MKINEKILSLPPYISTSWKNIFSIHIENRVYGPVLLIELTTGSKVEIPHLDPKIIEKVFTMHASVMEQEKNPLSVQTFALPLNNLMGNGLMDGFSSLMQHNPEQADTPPLPAELIDKLKGLKTILPEEALSKPEPHCNCPYCQIVRAITAEEATEEVVSDEELKFREWDIHQENDKLYSVTDPFNKEQHFSVFLGDPIGCTCGEKHCKHIDAVLKTDLKNFS